MNLLQKVTFSEGVEDREHCELSTLSAIQYTEDAVIIKSQAIAAIPGCESWRDLMKSGFPPLSPQLLQLPPIVLPEETQQRKRQDTCPNYSA